MTTTNKFLESVREHRESKKKEKFSGTLEDYLRLVEEDKKIPVLAHKRLYDRIISEGITTLDESDERCSKLFNGEPLKVYDYFSAQFFGMERPLQKIVRFLHSGAM